MVRLLGFLTVAFAALSAEAAFGAIVAVADFSHSQATAEMTFTVEGNKLTVTIKNTTDAALGSPAIDGFGFNVNPAVVSWTLTAFAADGSVKTLGDSDSDLPSEPDLWQIDTNAGPTGQVKFDYFPTNGPGVQYGLYNPEILTDPNPYPTSPDPYYTDATLTMWFAAGATPTVSTGTDQFYVRMQNVGLDGKNSLKLLDDGNSGGTGPNEVTPEPTSLAIWGLGALGIVAGRSWRRRSRQSV